MFADGAQASVGEGDQPFEAFVDVGAPLEAVGCLECGEAVAEAAEHAQGVVRVGFCDLVAAQDCCERGEQPLTRGGQRIVRAGRFHAECRGVPAGVFQDEGAEGERGGREGVAARVSLDRVADGVGGLAQRQGRDAPVEVLLAAYVFVQGRGTYAHPLGQQAHCQVGEAHLVGEGGTGRDHGRRVQAGPGHGRRPLGGSRV